MNIIRYVIAVMLTVAIPGAIVFWLMIHPFARYWRRKGKSFTYWVTCSVLLLIMSGMFLLRGVLLQTEWGTNWFLVSIGAILLALSGWLRKLLASELPIPVLVGLPEVTGVGHLITSGMYSRVRHPRYLQMDLALIGYALVANYPAGYAAALLWLVGIRIVVLFEERELTERFGNEYRNYCRHVPRFIPRGIIGIRKGKVDE
ncbi:PEMT/PEM2 methyltransferase family protein [Geobacter sp. OR-1]|uniref:methyltransferase family protein n=1 Tax=Geobacter sp. OR-1 TaxID=1266765 RepID=UPI000544055B|nr:isoprenylcysteine carboxylmethyltransferase family protein [Geobacter sp. OR-1]GAM10413.1 PEMT/PEM2 methyltransferase family protein [Geobacter sp. OR-1]